MSIAQHCPLHQSTVHCQLRKLLWMRLYFQTKQSFHCAQRLPFKKAVVFCVTSCAWTHVHTYIDTEKKTTFSPRRPTNLIWNESEHMHAENGKNWVVPGRHLCVLAEGIRSIIFDALYFFCSHRRAIASAKKKGGRGPDKQRNHFASTSFILSDTCI